MRSPLSSAGRSDTTEDARADKDTPVVLDARVVTGTGGGPDKTILNSPRFLKAAGYRMLCAYMHPPGDPGFDHLRARAQAWGAPLLSIPDRGAWDWRVFTRLLEICRRERVTIWHGHDYKSDALGLLLRAFRPMRLVTTVHGWGVAGTRPLYNRIDRICLPRYERVVCVSEDLRRQCLASGVAGDRCVLIANAIDTEQFTRTRDAGEAKALIGIPPGRLVIGSVGRLSGEKAYEVLILAADRLLGQGFDIELLIVGEGKERTRLESLISELGRGDRFRLAGFRSDTVTLYEAMDVFALSSLSEGLPNVLLEAMAMGVPVVATRIAGVPGLISHGENGLLADPGSVDSLADGLAQVLGDPELRQRLRREGRQTVETDFSFAVRMRKIGLLYDSMLGRVGPESAYEGRLTP